LKRRPQIVLALGATAIAVTAGLFAACTAAPPSAQKASSAVSDASASAAASEAATVEPTATNAPAGEPAETAAPAATEGTESEPTKAPEENATGSSEGTGGLPDDYAENPKEPAAISKDAVKVSVLSDSHVASEGSWFRQTVEANRVPGARLGVFVAESGATATALESKLDQAVAAKGMVIIQAGTNDLGAGTSASATAENVRKLLQGIKDRGATPILALIPPSATKGAEVRETNRLLSEYAAGEDIGVLDLTSDVAGPDGQWRAGLSDDGVHANAAGAKIMAAAAAEQLPSLIH
jgi:lysophospholipase L1-like esterase